MLAYLYWLSKRLVRGIVLGRRRRIWPFLFINFFILSQNNPSLLSCECPSNWLPSKYAGQLRIVKVRSRHRSVLFSHHFKLLAKRDAFDGSLQSFSHSFNICFLFVIVLMRRLVRFNSVHNRVILMGLYHWLVFSHYF